MHGGVRLIPLSAIQAFAGDTVLLPACELRHPGALPLQAAALELRTLLRASAMTARGQRLGRVAEVEVYPSDGRITALTVTCGRYFGIGARVERVAGERIGRFERRAVIVGPSPALVSDLPPHA